jgi:shikimate dehydrogenase
VSRRAAVLGSPIAHSLSPVLHRAAYAELGLDWRYDAYDVGEDDLPAFLDEVDDGWVGLSLTMPLKRAVLPLLHWTSAGASAVQAVNTVVFARGRRLGTNTDVPGMSAALLERGVTRIRTATVLGGGATAASALAALASSGVKDPRVVVRRASSADALRPVAGQLGQQLHVEAWSDGASALGADVVVQTTPSGAADTLADSVPDRPGVLFDVVYDPWPTPLAAAWEAAGGTVLNGLDLLVHQAVLQVRLMTGVDVRTGTLVGRLREAGLRELAARA